MTKVKKVWTRNRKAKEMERKKENKELLRKNQKKKKEKKMMKNLNQKNKENPELLQLSPKKKNLNLQNSKKVSGILKLKIWLENFNKKILKVLNL